MRALRHAAALLVVCACVVAVVGYQSDRPAAARPNPVIFVPSPTLYHSFSPGMRATLGDVYWLATIQYYGEHVNADHRLDSLPAMVRLVTDLSPHFTQAYFFGAFAMIDAGRPDVAYGLLKSGFAANPRNWQFPFYLGFFAYTYATNSQRYVVAAQWYAKAARLPGRPDFVPRLAAELATKGNSPQIAIDLWTQVWVTGDRTGDTYARQKAVAALDKLLPTGKVARESAVAGLKTSVPRALFSQFVADLFQGY